MMIMSPMTFTDIENPLQKLHELLPHIPLMNVAKDIACSDHGTIPKRIQFYTQGINKRRN